MVPQKSVRNLCSWLGATVPPSWGINGRVKRIVAAIALLTSIALFVFSVLPRPILGDLGEGPRISIQPLFSPTIGDDYYPQYGNGGYDALSYETDLTWDPDSQTLAGRSTMTAVATASQPGLALDFLGQVSGVTFNGEATSFTRLDDVNVAIDHALVAGETFTVTSTYISRPDSDCDNAIVEGGTLVLAAEPAGASCFMPNNDHPSDPATYRFTMRATGDQVGLGPGKLLNNSGGVTQYEVTHPAPTYATMVLFGEFDLVEANGSMSAIDSRLDGATQKKMRTAIEASAGVAEELSSFLGPYPADATGGIATASNPAYGALETSGRPVYLDEMFTNDIIAHELAHMWFGNRVTLASWDDLWLNEGMASYAAMVYLDRTGGMTAQESFDSFADNIPSDDPFWQTNIRDAGENPFSFEVYQRGAMAMHALRNVIGDDTFFALWKEWGERSGPATVDEFIAASEAASGKDLTAFFDAWLNGTANMPRTPEYGFK